jgi:hypothetical protein
VVSLPDTWSTPVVRTDFSDPATWERVRAEIVSRTEEGFRAGVEFVEDRAFEGVHEQAILDAAPGRYPDSYRHPVVFVADARTITGADNPLLVLDLSDPADRPFRATPRAVQSIENNLSIANMDYAEFRAAVDPDGVFRGF